MPKEQARATAGNLRESVALQQCLARCAHSVGDHLCGQLREWEASRLHCCLC